MERSRWGTAREIDRTWGTCLIRVCGWSALGFLGESYIVQTKRSGLSKTHVDLT